MDTDINIFLSHAFEVFNRYEGVSVLLRFKEGKSDKFYHLEKRGVSGNNSYETRWGKWKGFNPSGGQSQKMSSSVKFYDTLRAKVKKGYTIVQVQVTDVTKPESSQLARIAYIRRPYLKGKQMHYTTWGKEDEFLAFIDSATVIELLNVGIPLRSYNQRS